MAKLKNAYDYTDLLRYAEANGISHWNETIRLFQENDILPFSESRYREYYKSELEDTEEYKSDYEWDERVKRIFLGFMEQENIDMITLVDG